MPQGHKHSEETRRKLSESHKRFYAEHPEAKKLYSARLREWYAQHPKTLSAEYRQKISKSLMGHQVSEETRKKLSDSHIGLTYVKTKKERESISKRMKQRNPMKDPSTRAKMSRTMKEIIAQNPNKLDKMHEASRAPEVKARIASSVRKSLLQQWQDPELRYKRILGTMRSIHSKPNKTEQRLLNLLQQEFPWQYEYVGDGRLIIEGLCPDFANVNGQKKVIELFGDYWHRGETGQERTAHFARYGYDTLIIWENEINNGDRYSLITKLREFHEK